MNFTNTSEISEESILSSRSVAEARRKVRLKYKSDNNL